MNEKKPKQGYKLVKSLFGKYEEIPEEWDSCKMKDVCKKISVGIATSTTKHFVDKGVPLLRNQNIKEGYIETDNLLYISESFAKLNESRKLHVGDVVCMRTGYPGQSAVVPPEMNGWQTFTTLIVRPKNEILDSQYLSMFLNSNGRKQIISVQAGAAQQNLNAGWLSNMLILIPELNEQQKIASILSNVDNLISSYDKVIDSTKLLKQGLMQQLLTRGIGHKKFKKVKWLFGKEIEIPEEWDYQNLKATTKLFGGYAFKSEDYVQNGIYLLKISNVSHGNLVWDDESFLPDDFWNAYPDYRICPGDLVMAMTRPIISTGIKIAHIVENKKILLNQRVGKFLTILNMDFLNSIINSKYFIVQIKRGLSESNQPNISSSEVEATKIWYPIDIQEQQKIASILNTVDAKISELKSKKYHLEKLKKRLMQKLLVGQIRVKT